MRLQTKSILFGPTSAVSLAHPYKGSAYAKAKFAPRVVLSEVGGQLPPYCHCALPVLSS